MTDTTKLDTRSLSAEEEAILDACFRGNIHDLGSAIVCYSRALFAPPESEMEKAEWTGNVKCPDCGRLVNEAHCGGPNHVYQRVQPAPPEPSAIGSPEWDKRVHSSAAKIALATAGMTTPPEPAAREMPEAVKTEAERGLEEVYRFNDGRSLRRNGVVFETHGKFSYRDVLSKADTRELIQHFERNLAQPVAVGMTEELEELLRWARDAAGNVGALGYPSAQEDEKRIRMMIDKVRQQAARGRKVELWKVRDALQGVIDQRHKMVGTLYSMAVEGMAELDAAEGKGEGRG